MIDLTVPGSTKLLAEQIQADITATGARPGKYSWRIKPSNLGKECVAQLWYSFRWVRKTDIPAQLGNVFDAGNDTEPRLMAKLRRAGWEVLDEDPSKAHKESFRQWNFKALDGHMSAYLDGIGRHPVRTGGLWALIEAKSYNKRRFGLLVSKGVQLSDFEYYVQVVIYLKAYDLPFCVFICECKDNGEEHVEIITRNDDIADRHMSIGQTVKNTRVRPARVAESAAFHKCKQCDFAGVCHLGEQPDKNCRSCVNAVAIENGKFGCVAYQQVIPDQKHMMEYAPTCPHYEAVR